MTRLTYPILPQKVTQGAQGRRLVYLDQNVVSDLAKRRLGRVPEGPRKQALTSLAEALRVAVQEKETARCVESFFHNWESSALVGERARQGSDELFRTVWEFVITHSWGLHFRMTGEVGQMQTLLAVAALNQHPHFEWKGLWRAAFAKNPMKSNEQCGVRVGKDVFMMGVPWRPQTILRPGWARNLEQARSAGRYATFQAALADVQQQIKDDAISDNQLRSWTMGWVDYEHPMPRSWVDTFLADDGLARLPLHDIQQQMFAQVLSDHRRTLRDSDAVDIEILSLALPYCDLVITDTFMATLVKSLKLDNAYGALVLPATDQGLLQAAQWLA